MRKKDLMFTHALLVKCVEFMEETEELDRENDILDEYNDVDLSRPRDPRAMKSEQKAAVFALLSDINTTVDDLDADTTSEDAQTGTVSDTDDEAETETDTIPSELTVA